MPHAVTPHPQCQHPNIRQGVECVWNVNGTRAETTFRLSAKQTSPFKSAWASVQSTTGSRCVHISGSNAGYTRFLSSVKITGYPLHSPVSPSLPLPCVVCHHISTTLLQIVNIPLNYLLHAPVASSPLGHKCPHLPSPEPLTPCSSFDPSDQLPHPMQQSISAVNSTEPPTSTAMIREPWQNPFHLQWNVLKCLDTKSYLPGFLTFEEIL